MISYRHITNRWWKTLCSVNSNHIIYDRLYLDYYDIERRTDYIIVSHDKRKYYLWKNNDAHVKCNKICNKVKCNAMWGNI